MSTNPQPTREIHHDSTSAGANGRTHRRSRRLATGVLLAGLVVSLLMGLSSTANASIAPVQYASGSSGHLQCFTTSGFADGTSFSYVDVAPPTRVVDYTGTYTVRWSAQLYEWVNGRWVFTGQSNSTAHNAVYTSGWLQIGYWSGPQGLNDLELTAAAGAYFTVVEATGWYNSAGQMITSNVNGSNVAAC